jgi:transposase InsO family protein
MPRAAKVAKRGLRVAYENTTTVQTFFGRQTWVELEHKSDETMRDRDCIFGADFTRQMKEFGIQEVLGAPRAPRQRAYVERVIGTIRRECLDHEIVFGEASLYQHMKLFLSYYHESRTHLSLAKVCRGVYTKYLNYLNVVQSV